MIKLFVAALVLVSASAALAGETTIRDNMGRVQGTISNDGHGGRTFRDSMGRETGTATTDSQGTTTFRDNMGRITGTATRR